MFIRENKKQTLVTFEHLNKKYGFERQPRQPVVQLEPEDFFSDSESESDLEIETTYMMEGGQNLEDEASL